MLIKELEDRTGLTRHTIRFYEKQHLLGEHSFRRQENNYRDYSEETVQYLMILKAGQAAGFTLAEFKELLDADKENRLPLQSQVEVIRQKIYDIERKKAELDQMSTFLAEELAKKLAWIEAEKNGEAHDYKCVIPEHS